MGIYGASKFTEKGIKEFLKNSVSLAAVLLHSVLICGILLIPTAFVLFGRGGSGSQAGMAVSLFTVQPMRFLYTPHGVGMSALALIALFDDMICRRKGICTFWSRRKRFTCRNGSIAFYCSAYAISVYTSWCRDVCTGVDCLI